MKTKSGLDEYGNFSNALKKVLQVSHSEIKARIETEKNRGKRLKRRPASSSADRRA